ncbi:MAG: B12-binding domain-containing radical SAM protein [Lentisphaerae bacterium]|nr:B12-binding domain-containing radical SAM protein [Lentisphaerota bacterium]
MHPSPQARTALNTLFINPFPFELFPAPGIGYLKAVLEREDIGHQTWFADRNSLGAVLERVPPLDLIAVSIHSFAVPFTAAILPELRRRHPHARLVCGGHHPSALPQQMLNLGFDQVVTGPGELAFLEIARGRTDPVIAGESPDLDSLPWPDYPCQLPQIPSDLPIIGSRGCPFHCSFCASSHFWKRRWTPRSCENILQELAAWLDRGVMREFMFEDDNFTLKKARTLELCEGIRTRLLPRYPGLRWQCASRAPALADEELCRALVTAGCFRVWLGVESGSQTILNRCRKNLIVQEQIEGIQTARRCGLRTMAQLIIGLLGETEDTLRETCRFIQLAQPSDVGINIAWTLPNTDLHAYARERGFSDDDYIRKGVPYFTWEHDETTLRQWAARVQLTLKEMSA